ncbi:MAG: hypothetical protein AAF846_22590 [Chloroflexota bacterium]
MQLECPQCSKPLDEKHIDPRANIVTCDTCGAVFSTPSSRVSSSHKSKKDAVTIPKRFTVNLTGESLQIAYKHNACMGIVVGVFALFWNGMLWAVFVPTFLFAGISSVSESNWEGLIFPLFLIPFILVGLFVAYTALFQLLNTTTVRATHKALSIQHRPMSIPFDKTIDTNTIQQLFTKRKVTSGSGGDTITYDVYMMTNEGKKKKLLAGFSEAEQALYIEDQLEEFLGIIDEYVEGQYD